MVQNDFTAETQLLADAQAGDRSEAQLLASAQAGDRAATLTLTERYAPLVRRESRERYLAAVAPRAELESIATLALLEAIRDYDAAAGVHFAGFAARRVHDALYSEFRRARRDWERTTRPDQSEHAASLWERYGGESNPSDSPETQTERRELARQAMAMLTPTERRLLELIYYAEMPLREIAPQVNKSYQTVARMRDKILSRLREALTIEPILAY